MSLWRSHKVLLAGCLLLMLFAAGCKKKPVAAAPPAPPPSPAPTATLRVNPTSIERGQSATLAWTTTNASEVSLDGSSVPATGSRSVRPSQSATFRLVAKGPGGTADASARLTVTVPPAPIERPTPPPSRSIEQLWLESVKTIYFDYDKYEVRADQRAALEGNGRFFLAHPDLPITIEGSCDERGSAQYNLGLGEKRSTALKDFLVSMGVPASRLNTISYGKEKPVCTESSEDCWQRNRRGDFVRRTAP